MACTRGTNIWPVGKGEKPQVERRLCDAQAELGSDVGMWESCGFPSGRLTKECWCVHTHQEGRKVLWRWWVQVSRALKWHHFLSSEGPQGERMWEHMRLSFRKSPLICPFFPLS